MFHGKNCIYHFIALTFGIFIGLVPHVVFAESVVITDANVDQRCKDWQQAENKGGDWVEMSPEEYDYHISFNVPNDHENLYLLCTDPTLITLKKTLGKNEQSADCPNGEICAGYDIEPNNVIRVNIGLSGVYDYDILKIFPRVFNFELVYKPRENTNDATISEPFTSPAGTQPNTDQPSNPNPRIIQGDGTCKSTPSNGIILFGDSGYRGSGAIYYAGQEDGDIKRTHDFLGDVGSVCVGSDAKAILYFKKNFADVDSGQKRQSFKSSNADTSKKRERQDDFDAVKVEVVNSEPPPTPTPQPTKTPFVPTATATTPSEVTREPLSSQSCQIDPNTVPVLLLAGNSCYPLDLGEYTAYDLEIGLPFDYEYFTVSDGHQVTWCYKANDGCHTFTQGTYTAPSNAGPLMYLIIEQSNESPEQTAPEIANPFVERAVYQLARELGIDYSMIRVISFEKTTWPDSSLGCPQPGEVYLQVLTAGYLIRLSVNELDFELHTGDRADGPIIRCGQDVPRSNPGNSRPSDNNDNDVNSPPSPESGCSGARASMVGVGMSIRVSTKYDPLMMREGAGYNQAVLERLAPDTLLDVTGNSICVQSELWWPVRTSWGTTGWVVEGTDSVDPHFILPAGPGVQGGPERISDICVSGDDNRTRWQVGDTTPSGWTCLVGNRWQRGTEVNPGAESR